MTSDTNDRPYAAESGIKERNWGRWGIEDEAGTLNLVSSKEVLSATLLVKTGEIVRLDQPLNRSTPSSSHRAPLSRFMDRTSGDYGHQHRGFAFSEDTVQYPSHSGTHVDSLAHVWEDESLYNGFPSSTITNRRGAGKCGVDKMPPVVGRGVLVDLVAYRGGVALEGGEAVDASEIEACLSWQNVEVQAGDAVLLRTGWWESRGDSSQYFESEPGPTVSAARWLADRDVSLVGADNYAFEVQPNAEQFPVHRMLLRDCGTPIIEGLVLAQLAQHVEGPFLFIMTPLPFIGSTASVVAPIAVL